jgi:hypothetical protein
MFIVKPLTPEQMESLKDFISKHNGFASVLAGIATQMRSLTYPQCKRGADVLDQAVDYIADIYDEEEARTNA